MAQTYWIALAWIGGMLARSLPLGWVWPLAVGTSGAVIVAATRRGYRHSIRTWLVAGLVGCLAWFYVGWRLPVPSPSDISAYAPQSAAEVVGVVRTTPQATRAPSRDNARSGRQIWLAAQQYRSPEGIVTPVRSKLYVTYTLNEAGGGAMLAGEETESAVDTQAEGPLLWPGQTVRLVGMLYRPSGADNPGSFDFRRYLAKQGAFAGFSARSVEVVDTRIHWGIWHWRHRIVSSFVQGLGERRGELLGALVLGARASQMDFDLQDTFRAVGLSHLMAASGFQVSVLLAVALAAMRTWQKSVRQAIALAVLLAYAGLTGGGPSILRATMMGSVAIVALEDGLGGKRLRPLGLLLLTAVLLLLAQPLWIDDLGFQLSFLATLGLLVAAKPWQQHLEFLPPAMAAAVAIPLAALLWTLPLQLSAFGKIAPYSLVADLCITPLAIAAIVAGFGVSAFALLMPSVGAVLAWPLRVLLDPLLGFAAWIASWPHAQSYVGALPRWQCVALYVLLAIATFGPQLSILPQRWIGKLHNRLAIGVSGTFIVAVLLPALWPAPLVQIVALAAREPVLVVHSQGGTAIVNSGSDETVAQVVLPYLRHAGIHRIHKALALADGAANSGWDVLVANIAVEQFWSEDRFEISSEAAAVVETLRESGTVLHSLGREPSLQMGSVTWQSVEPNVLKMSLPGYQWLLLGAPVTSTSHLPQLGLLPPVQWVWWDGSLLPPDLLGELDTQGGMVGGDRLVPTNETQFAAAEVPLYWTERVGAVQWTPSGARLNQPDLS